MASVASFFIILIYIYIVILLARVVLDFVQAFAREWEPRGIVLYLCEAIYTVTDPPIKALRKIIPALRLGGVSLDLSVLMLFIILQVVIWLLGKVG